MTPLDPEAVEKGARALQDRLAATFHSSDWNWDDSGQNTRDLAAAAFEYALAESGLPAQLDEWKARAEKAEAEARYFREQNDALALAVEMGANQQRETGPDRDALREQVQEAREIIAALLDAVGAHRIARVHGDARRFLSSPTPEEKPCDPCDCEHPPTCARRLARKCPWPYAEAEP